MCLRCTFDHQPSLIDQPSCKRIGFNGADVTHGLFVDSSAFNDYCTSNRVAPVCVNLSVHTSLWGRLFIGVTPPDREALMPSKEGGGPKNNL